MTFANNPPSRVVIVDYEEWLARGRSGLGLSDEDFVVCISAGERDGVYRLSVADVTAIQGVKQ